MFIISEIFPQHGGDLDRAEQMILQSKLAGADAAKVQLYPASMFPGKDGSTRDYLELSFDGLVRLHEYANKVGLTLFGTAFDQERLGWCKELDFKFMKIAARMHKESPDLVQEILDLKKTTFVSVPSDFDTAHVKVVDHGVYLYCILKYPTRLDEVTFPDFHDSIFTGFSDHSLGIGAALMASAKGARFLEKHFTLSHAHQKNTEQAHLGSMTMDELAQIRTLTSEFELLSANPSA